MLNPYQVSVEGSAAAVLFHAVQAQAYSLLDQADTDERKHLATYIAGTVMSARYELEKAAKRVEYRVESLARDAERCQHRVANGQAMSTMDIYPDHVVELHTSSATIGACLGTLRTMAQLALDCGFKYQAGKELLAATDELRFS